MTRDKDGFLVLKRRTPGYDDQVFRAHIGNSIIFMGEDMSMLNRKPSRNLTNFRSAVQTTAVHIEYQPKTWQYKAWSVISKGLNLWGHSPFIKCAGSERLRHMLRIGVMMKVRGDTTTAKETLGQFTLPGSPYGGYTVASTPKELAELLNRWNRMILDVDIYLRMARKQNLDSIVYVPKVFIIYDDLSYDAHMGDPRYLFEELGVKFNKGGYVIL